jgi:hypothetical protein
MTQFLEILSSAGLPNVSNSKGSFNPVAALRLMLERAYRRREVIMNAANENNAFPVPTKFIRPNFARGYDINHLAAPIADGQANCHRVGVGGARPHRGLRDCRSNLSG